MDGHDLKVRLALLVLVAATLSPAQAFGQAAAKSHVAIVGFSNQTGVSSYDAACKAASDTLLLSFEQLGRYTARSLTLADRSEDGLRALAEKENLDFVVYGTMAKKATGIICDLSVFDRAKGKVTLSRTGKASGVLDIFDATDDLVVAVMESMTGAHIGFGSATLTNKGEPGSYAVSVDGYPVGENLQSLDKLLIGRHTVRITQKRMLGEREIAKADIAVAEGGTVDVPFAVPLLMDDEKARLAELKSAIQSGWTEIGKATEVDGHLAQLASLFADVSYSPRLSAQKGESVQLGGEWALRKCRAGIEGSAWNPSLALLDAGGVVYQSAGTYPNPAKIRQSFEEDAQLVALLFELAGGKALGDGDFAKASTSLGNALMLSTRYLNGARMTDYAYALTMIQELQSGASPSKVRTVFGPWIDAAKRFYAIEDQVSSGTSIALLASDVSRQVSIEGADFVDAPLPISSKEGKATIAVLPKGADKPATVELSAGMRLAFVPDGFDGFGKLSLGAGSSNAAPGAIAASVEPENYLYTNASFTAQVSLDGGDPVDLPHTYEGVSAGSHVITVPETTYGTKRLKGFEETVTVEPGKRLEVSRTLALGRALLYIQDIPEGATLLVDGEEQSLANPSNDKIYDVPIDAGYRKIEVVQGNKNWSIDQYVDIGGERICSVKSMTLTTTLQRRSIKLKGKEEDWVGIDHIFEGSGFTKTPTISGSQISGGSICRDDSSIYIKMDFADGKPAFPPDSIRHLELWQDDNWVSLDLSAWRNGTVHTAIWYQKERRSYEGGSYAFGPSFIEMKFPISWLPKGIDLSKPVQMRMASFLNNRYDATANYSKTVGIVIGK